MLKVYVLKGGFLVGDPVLKCSPIIEYHRHVQFVIIKMIIIVDSRHGVNSIQVLELLGNSGIRIDYLKEN